MADPYAALASESEDMQARIADAMDERCGEPAQKAIRTACLGDIKLPSGAFAIEFGSGTGHVTRDLVDIAGA
ncbi:MAG: hypothetical protein AAGE83_07905, partial [Pseudomonadota bacterium]